LLAKSTPLFAHLVRMQPGQARHPRVNHHRRGLRHAPCLAGAAPRQDQNPKE
jgi:hypothetical protein